MAKCGVLVPSHFLMILIFVAGTASVCLGSNYTGYDETCAFLFQDDIGKSFQGFAICRYGCCGSISQPRCCEEEDGSGVNFIFVIFTAPSALAILVLCLRDSLFLTRKCGINYRTIFSGNKSCLRRNSLKPEDNLTLPYVAMSSTSPAADNGHD